MSLQNELKAAEVRLPVCAASSICPVAFSSPATLRFPLLARMSLSINYCRQLLIYAPTICLTGLLCCSGLAT